MAAYLGYTLRMKTLFCGSPVMVNETHTRRKIIGCDATGHDDDDDDDDGRQQINKNKTVSTSRWRRTKLFFRFRLFTLHHLVVYLMKVYFKDTFHYRCALKRYKSKPYKHTHIASVCSSCQRLFMISFSL